MIKRLIAASVIALATHSALADDAAQIMDRLKATYPNTRIQEVRPSTLPGLFEVVMGDNIAYTDATGRYFIFGHLFDMKEQVDMTAQRKLDTKKAEFPAAFLANAIKVVKGDGSRKLAVFSDPDCPYCKRLEGELAKLDNVTVYTFLYPLESLHPEAKTKAVSVWCARDRGKAWTDLMLTGQAPKLVACTNPLNDNLVLGSRLGVVGTPTLIAADGRVLPGAAPAAKIDQWLGGAK